MCLLIKQWILIILEVTRRRHWAMSSAVSPSGKKNTSSFQAPCQGHRLLVVEVRMCNKVHMSRKGHRLLLLAVHMSCKGHRLLLLAVHMSSKGHQLLVVAVHMSNKVHTYRRGGPARVHHLGYLRVSGTVRRLGGCLDWREHRRLFRSYLGKALKRKTRPSFVPRWMPILRRKCQRYLF